MSAWQTLETDPVARRLAVPGGWLYQVEIQNSSTTALSERPDYHYGWHPPVFVPDPNRGAR